MDNVFTYYCESAGGMVFGNNLAEVARRGGAPLRASREMLPVYFIYRFVPGGNTLFEGIKRLQPGEHVSYRDGQLVARQVQTFADLDEPRKTGEAESVERVEATMLEVLGSLMTLAPDAAGLLSGGVDSTYIQVHWNKLLRGRGDAKKPRTAAVWLDHPRTLPDREYSLSAARELDTDHLAVRIAGLGADLMSNTLSTIGEMPNHVQSFYFGPLARMAQGGITAGLCGEGADGLFGNGDAALLQYSDALRGRFPTRPLRRLGQFMAGRFGRSYAAEGFRVANILENTADKDHPLNTAAAFTDYASVAACFGREACREAANYPTAILDLYRVPRDALHLGRTMGKWYFVESVNTAAYWNHLACEHGVQFLCPFMDSRMIRAAVNIDIGARFVPGNPKQILKKSLARHLPEDFAARPKRGFGQPIFEWLGDSGPLCEAVNAIGDYDFIDRAAWRAQRASRTGSFTISSCTTFGTRRLSDNNHARSFGTTALVCLEIV